MRRSEEDTRHRRTPKKTTITKARPKKPGTPPRPGHYKVVTEGGSAIVDGDFPSRAAARRQAAAMATYTPAVAKGKPPADPITVGYCWVELPEAAGS